MTNYTSVDRIFAKLDRDLGIDIPERDVIEWIGEALQGIGTPQLNEEAISFLEVKDFKAKLPNGTTGIVQIARNNMWSASTKDILCPQTILETCKKTTTTTDTPSIPVALDCDGMPINDYDLAYYRPYFDMRLEHFGWYNSSYYQNGYSPVRKAQSSFFEASEKGQTSPYNNKHHRDEYKIIGKNVIRFSFQEGSVAIALQRIQIDDETGYPLVPDTYSHLTAISMYVAMKVQYKMYMQGRQGAEGRWKDMSNEWQWYCKQASNQDMMPKGVDDLQDIGDMRNHMLLITDHYDSFFGNLTLPEHRRWNDPDGRNNNGRLYFRGI